MGSPTTVTKPVNNGKLLGNGAMAKASGNGRTRNGSISEGEILEDLIPAKSEGQEKSIESKTNTTMAKGNDQALESLVMIKLSSHHRTFAVRTLRPDELYLRILHPCSTFA